MDNMILCDGNNYDWVHMAWTRCIIENPSEPGNHLVVYYKLIVPNVPSHDASLSSGNIIEHYLLCLTVIHNYYINLFLKYANHFCAFYYKFVLYVFRF